LEKVRVFIEGTVASHQSSLSWEEMGEIWGKDWGVTGGEKGKCPVEVTRVKGSKKFRGKNGRVWG